MTKEVSILSGSPDKQIAALRESRLSMLIKDQTTLQRIAEAAVLLLTNDKLRACDEQSILGALYKAATLGFRLEPEFGECYLIPRSIKDGKDEQGKDKWKAVCVFQIGYKGWRAKALESGHVVYIGAREVFEEDEFYFEYGTAAVLKHRPANENKGVMTHFYAFAKLREGFEIFEVINKQAAERSRKNSETQYDWIGQGANKQKQFSETPKDIWGKHYAAMANRVPIKKLCATLPLSAAIETATLADGSITYLQKDGTVTTVTPVDVEKLAETDEQELKIEIENVEKFLQTKDALGSMNDFSDVLKFYEQFKESEFAKSQPFVTLFFETVVRTAKSKDDLNDFYNSAKDWQKTPALVKMLSKRKKDF